MGQRRFYKDKVIVLTYHHIDPDEQGIAISPQRFQSHMRTLKKNGFRVISMDRFVQFIRGKETVPQNAVLITFDDGYESFLTYAHPVLKKYKFPATNFLVVKLVDDNLPPKRLSYDPYYHHPRLGWKQIRKLKKDGMSFHSHTYNQHLRNEEGRPILRNPVYLKKEKRFETRSEFIHRIHKDLKLAEKRIRKELGKQPRILCFPYGAYNEKVLDAGRQAGIELFFTTKEGINSKKQGLIYRLNAGSERVTNHKLIKMIREYSRSLHEWQGGH